MSRGHRVDVHVDRHDDHLDITWRAGPASGACRFDHLAGTSPEWLGSGEELVGAADRRTADRIIDAVSDWARAEGLDVGLWHDGAEVERLA